MRPNGRQTRLSTFVDIAARRDLQLDRNMWATNSHTCLLYGWIIDRAHENRRPANFATSRYRRRKENWPWSSRTQPLLLLLAVVVTVVVVWLLFNGALCDQLWLGVTSINLKPVAWPSPVGCGSWKLLDKTWQMDSIHCQMAHWLLDWLTDFLTDSVTKWPTDLFFDPSDEWFDHSNSGSIRNTKYRSFSYWYFSLSSKPFALYTEHYRSNPAG